VAETWSVRTDFNCLSVIEFRRVSVLQVRQRRRLRPLHGCGGVRAAIWRDLRSG
jgi:hypothetical protein